MKPEKLSRKASIVTNEFISETIYDPIQQQTQFATFANNEVGYADFVTIESGDIVYPLSPKNDIVKKCIVRLPTTASEYGTEKDLILDIRNFIHKYVDVSIKYEGISTYYVLLSWLYDRFHELPYLRVIGDPGTGKSRFLLTVGSLCYRPIFTGGATTTAPIFRILDELKGTLIMDEADLRFSDMTADMVKILNMGYSKDGSVMRMVGKNLDEIKAFDVFGPKILGTREQFDDKALESRFLIEEMGGVVRDDIPLHLPDQFHNEAAEIRNKLLLWRFRNYRKELVFEDRPLENAHPRLSQIIIPLLAIIEDAEMKKSLKDFATESNKELIADRGLSRESDIIFAIFRIEYLNKKNSLTVKEIADYVNVGEDGFSVDEKEKLSPKKIGWYLRAKLQLKPYKTRKGFVIEISRNQTKLDFWKGRFGITDADIKGELVNDVNIVEGIDTKDLVF